MNPFDTTESPVTEPESLLVGSYVKWRRLLDYDSATYSLSYRFTSLSDATTQTLAGTYDSTNEWWTFELITSALSAWTAGTHRWDLLLTRTSDSEVVVVATGSLELFATTADRRTHAEVMVAKIESLIEGRADADVESYSIKSRSITKMSIKELREWRDYYIAEVERTGGSTSGAVRPRKNTIRVRWV